MQPDNQIPTNGESVQQPSQPAHKNTKKTAIIIGIVGFVLLVVALVVALIVIPAINKPKEEDYVIAKDALANYQKSVESSDISKEFEVDYKKDSVEAIVDKIIKERDDVFARQATMLDELKPLKAWNDKRLSGLYKEFDSQARELFKLVQSSPSFDRTYILATTTCSKVSTKELETETEVSSEFQKCFDKLDEAKKAHPDMAEWIDYLRKNNELAKSSKLSIIRRDYENAFYLDKLPQPPKETEKQAEIKTKAEAVEAALGDLKKKLNEIVR